MIIWCRLPLLQVKAVLRSYDTDTDCHCCKWKQSWEALTQTQIVIAASERSHKKLWHRHRLPFLQVKAIITSYDTDTEATTQTQIAIGSFWHRLLFIDEMKVILRCYYVVYIPLARRFEAWENGVSGFSFLLGKLMIWWLSLCIFSLAPRQHHVQVRSIVWDGKIDLLLQAASGTISFIQYHKFTDHAD